MKGVFCLKNYSGNNIHFAHPLPPEQAPTLLKKVLS